jgi:hypothetical protein
MIEFVSVRFDVVREFSCCRGKVVDANYTLISPGTYNEHCADTVHVHNEDNEIVTL